ncbi:MAG: hypothetical protein ABEJ68_10305 [Halobacteriaceae archaeon]
MSRGGEVPEYSRQDLRKATRFVEGDYKGINPREFYRRLKRSLEEIQSGNDFKYQTSGVQDEDLEIKSEEVGQKTGRVDGRLVAESDWELVGSGVLEYKPYGPHGALSIVLGLLLAGVGALGKQMPLAGLGVVLVLVGGYFYFQTDTESFPVVRRDVIRALMTGEVSERTIEDTDETRTDIFANMSVIYAGDTLVKVNTSRLDDLDWTFRRALVKQVKEWHDRIATSDSSMPDKVFDPDEGFTDELSAWTDRDARAHRQSIETAQDRINRQFSSRLRYTDLLLDQLPGPVQNELDEQQDALREELEHLAEDMDVYVEREGLTRTG